MGYMHYGPKLKKYTLYIFILCYIYICDIILALLRIINILFSVNKLIVDFFIITMS